MLPTLWFRNTWSWARKPSPSPAHPRRIGRIRPSGPSTRAWRVLPLRRAGADAPVLRERDEQRARVRRRGGDARSRRTASATTRARRAHRQPCDEGHQGRCARPARSVPGGGQATVLVRLTRAVPEQLTEPFAERGRAARAAAGRSGRVLRGDHAARGRRMTRSRSCGRRWRGCSGPSSATTSTSTSGCGSGRPIRCGRRVRRGVRNESWFHMFNQDVISMPDKWEYPWYAAWDLAFHCIPLAMVDPDFAKSQIDLMLSQQYLHPSGQMPAYEWNFGDVNPPVHAFATLFLHNLEADLGDVDLPFLREELLPAAAELHVVGEPQGPIRPQRLRGRVPRAGQHRRVRPQRDAAHRRTPRAGRRHRVDGDVQPEHARARAGPARARPQTYEDLVLKFVEHFFWIAAAVDPMGDHPDEMWDEEDGFFYDVLRLPDGTGTRLKVRSLVGLLPICAATVIEPTSLERYPQIAGQVSALPRAQPRPAHQRRRSARARRQRPAHALARERGQAAADPDPDA